MIGSLLLLIAGTIINIYGLLVSSITLALPDTVQTAIAWLFSSVNVLSGIFPVQTLMSAALFIISVWLIKVAIKIILWLLSFIPGFGHHDLPEIMRGDPNTTDLRRLGRNTVDLKHSRFKGRIDKKMRF